MTNPPPDYSSVLNTAMQAPNFAQLQVAAYQLVNELYAATTPPTDPAIVLWLQANATDRLSIDATLQKLLCFIVVDPALLPFQGALQQADLPTLSGVLGKLLGNYIAASARAKVAA